MRFVRLVFAFVALLALLPTAACSTTREEPVDVGKVALGILEVAAAVAPNSEARALIEQAQQALVAGDLTEATRLLNLARETWKERNPGAPPTGPPSGP